MLSAPLKQRTEWIPFLSVAETLTWQIEALMVVESSGGDSR